MRPILFVAVLLCICLALAKCAPYPVYLPEYKQPPMYWPDPTRNDDDWPFIHDPKGRLKVSRFRAMSTHKDGKETITWEAAIVNPNGSLYFIEATPEESALWEKSMTEYRKLRLDQWARENLKKGD